jgi:hypothetical protein
MQPQDATPQPNGVNGTTQDPTLKEPGMDATSAANGQPSSDADTAAGTDAAAGTNAPNTNAQE